MPIKKVCDREEWKLKPNLGYANRSRWSRAHL